MSCVPWNTSVKGGQGESAKQYIEGLSEAIRRTGHVPKALQVDHGPAMTKVKEWCEARDIKVIPAAPKNARSKPVEGMIGRLQTLVTRHCASWSGQNLTSTGANSQQSPARLKQAAVQAPDCQEAMTWLRTTQLSLHNALAFKTWNGQSCNKSPDLLWKELASATQALSEQELARTAGFEHQVQLTKEGLNVQHDTNRYTFFPKIATDVQRKKATAEFAKIGANSPKSNTRAVYVLAHRKMAHKRLLFLRWGCLFRCNDDVEGSEISRKSDNFLQIALKVGLFSR